MNNYLYPKSNKYNKKLYLKIKYIIDFIISLFLIVLLIPLFIMIILLIKLSSRGPIFYSQKRIGQYRKTFNCIKFRTMHIESEDMLEKLLSENKEKRIEFNIKHKLSNDPRITSFGKFLRRTSLDELPQLINVIKMEMSIIGPRPIVQNETNIYGNNIIKVINIRPGISGLWQVSGRNKLTYKRRVELDVIYLHNFSLLMDLRILIRTIGVILFPDDNDGFY